jgi:hypothetical protein
MYIMLNSKVTKLAEIEGQLHRLSSHQLMQLVAANDVEASQVSTHRIY